MQIYSRRDGNAASKFGTVPVMQMPHFMRRGSVSVVPALPYQLTDGYLQGDAGGLREGVSAETR